MNIVRFLIDNQDRILKTLPEIDQNLTDQTQAHEKIKKHIQEYELYESLEENFLNHIRKMMGEENQSLMIRFCERGNAKVWALLDRLIQGLSTNHFPSIQQAFNELVAFEESHFNFKVRSFFPLLQRVTDHQILDTLGRKALNFYRRFYPAVAAYGDGEGSGPAVPAGRNRFTFLNRPKDSPAEALEARELVEA